MFLSDDIRDDNINFRSTRDARFVHAKITFQGVIGEKLNSRETKLSLRLPELNHLTNRQIFQDLHCQRLDNFIGYKTFRSD